MCGSGDFIVLFFDYIATDGFPEGPDRIATFAVRLDWLGPAHLHCELACPCCPHVASCDCEEFPYS